MKRIARVAGVGVDVHYKFSQVTMRDAAGRVVGRERLDHPDREALSRRLAAWPKAAPVVLEASFGWGWLSDVMEAAGLDVHLSNCYKVERMRQARQSGKTNRKDADLLALLPLEPTRWWEVWRAPPEVRDRREWMRYRADVVEMDVCVKNQVHALFHRHGIFHEFSDLFGAAGRRFLAALCDSGRHAGGELPEGALEALRGLVKTSQYLRNLLAKATRRLRGELERDELTRRLMKVPGIGLILAHVIQAEVGEIERFRHHRALASYACLAPRSDDTGEADPTRAPLGRHLGDRGNRTLKWAFIEAAHGAVRSGGKWRRMFDRATQNGRRDRSRGYVKVSRELVKVIFVVWRRGVEYTESPPPRPGSRRGRREDARPGTGQPCRPMVTA
jgi:transposase